MKLEKLLKEKDTNQTNFANYLNVSQKTISNYLNKKTEPTETILCKIADYFNVSLDYLCDRPWNNKIGYIPESKTELINNVLSLNDNETKELMIFIRGLKAGRSSSSDFKIFN